MKKLIEQRAALIQAFEDLKGKLETENRSVFTNEERTKVNDLKIQIEDLDNQIAVEKEFNAKRNVKLDNISASQPSKQEKEIVSEFRSFLNGGNSEYAQNGKFQIGFDVLKRATITTSTNGQFNHVQQAAGVSVNDSELVLAKLNISPLYFESGAVDHVSFSEITASFAGSEGASVSDATLTSASKRLTPAFVSASIEVSKAWLAQSKPENIEALMSRLKLAIDKALEKRTIDTFSTLTHIASGATGVTTSFFNAALQMEKSINSVPTGYIFHKDYIAKGKNSNVDSGSGIKAIQDMTLNGYPVVRATDALMSNSTHGYLVTKDAVALAYFGNGIEVEVVTDSTLARAGKVLLICSAMADGTYTDANKIAVIKNANKLS